MEQTIAFSKVDEGHTIRCTFPAPLYEAVLFTEQPQEWQKLYGILSKLVNEYQDRTVRYVFENVALSGWLEGPLMLVEQDDDITCRWLLHHGPVCTDACATVIGTATVFGGTVTFCDREGRMFVLE